MDRHGARAGCRIGSLAGVERQGVEVVATAPAGVVALELPGVADPPDVIPLPGLLDDSYLVIRIIENLDKGPQEFLDWDLDYPSRFLQRLMGPAITQRLDRIAEQAMDEVSTQLADLWQKMAHHA